MSTASVKSGKCAATQCPTGPSQDTMSLESSLRWQLSAVKNENENIYRYDSDPAAQAYTGPLPGLLWRTGRVSLALVTSALCLPPTLALSCALFPLGPLLPLPLVVNPRGRMSCATIFFAAVLLSVGFTAIVWWWVLADHWNYGWDGEFTTDGRHDEGGGAGKSDNHGDNGSGGGVFSIVAAVLSWLHILHSSDGDRSSSSDDENDAVNEDELVEGLDAKIAVLGLIFGAAFISVG